MKIMIATPAYDGKVHAQYANALAETCSMLCSQGISIDLFICPSGSLLCAERNRIMKRFMESDCTHILCIDSDLGWPALAVDAMIKHNVDFVAGVYPARKAKMFLYRACFNADGSLQTNGVNLVKMEAVPAGFMLIKKEVIQKVIELNPDLYFRPKDPNAPDGYALFNTMLIDKEFWGEDFVFCRLVLAAGFDIWADPAIQFDHDGNIGMFAEILTNREKQQ